MPEVFRVFAVDDDPFVLEVIRGCLGKDYVVETFESVDACRQRLETEKPDMFLLDVRMPGTDGYAFCQQIKGDAGLSRIPVVFVSSHDTIDARLKGYDAGGEDFVVKPFESDELLRKIRVAQQLAEQVKNIEEEKTRLSRQLEDSELLSSLVMANMDEYAILMRFIRELLSHESEEQVAVGVLEMLQRYHLDGVVQAHVSGRTLTLGAKGANLPLEISVINHVRTMERIFEFRSRSAYNYEKLTIMVNNMPIHDPDTCGRLRDHLCIAAECADDKLRAIEVVEANQRSQFGVEAALIRVRALTDQVRQASMKDRTIGSDIIFRMEQGVSKAFVTLGLSEDQELYLGKLINGFVTELAGLLDRGETINQALDDIAGRLAELMVVPPKQ